MEEQETREEKGDEEKISNSKGALTEKMRENPWILATLVLGILTLILLVGQFGITGNVISEKAAGQKLVDFAESQGLDLKLIEVNDEVSFYEVVFEIGGQKSAVYLTKDGGYMIQPTASLNEKDSSSTQEVLEYSEEDNQKIQEFSQCLAEKGMRVYYAGWCSACHKFIEIFGGLENMGSMMIECQTESRQPGEGADLCAVENISAFPTIKINGEKYSGGSWAFEAIAEVTGCPAPQLD